MGGYRIISSDDHVFEPPDLWTSRVESRFDDRAPRIVRLENGDDWWFTDGIKGQSVASGAQTGKRFEGNDKLSFTDQLEHVRAGAYDPDERIKDMDLDGIDASVVYPNQGVILYNLPDTELLNALFATYNDWIAEYCGAHPKRLKGVATINLDDVQWAVKQLERCHKLGLSGAMIPVFPPPNRGYHMPEYEPFWTAAEDLGMPLSLHIASNRPGSVDALMDIETLMPDYICNADYWVRTSIALMIYGGVFERHPKLLVGSVENEAAWAPFFLERLDYNYTGTAQLPHWHRFEEDMLPSDYFHRNIFLGFQEDALSIRDRHIIGVDNLHWGSDYPHIESTFPKSQQVLGEILADCTEEEKARIAGGNAARVYHIDHVEAQSDG